MRTMRSTWVLGLLLATACRGGARIRTVPEPEARLARARAQFRHGDWRALLSFQRLTFELGPGDPLLPEARYYLGECQFQTGDRLQAANEFRQVADLFPESPYAPLALLRAGDANLRLWRQPELDPTYGEEALAIYQELAGRYPGTDAAARAQLHVHQLKERFAEKTYRNGLFYLKRRAFDSAIIYFKDVVANYSETSWAPTALLRLVDSYRAVAYQEDLRETCAHLRRFYPKTPGIDRTCPADTTAGPS